MKFGTTDISDLKFGSTQVEKVYAGSTVVWENNLPPVIGTLSFSNVGLHTIELSCNAVDDIAVTGYDIYLNNVLYTSYTGAEMIDVLFDNIQSNTEHQIKVKAFDASGGRSDFSNTITFTTEQYTSDILGLTPILIDVPAQNNSTWIQVSENIGRYIGLTGRMVIKGTHGNSFRGDIQIDDINFGGTTYDPNSGLNGFQRNSSIASINDYEDVVWENLTYGSSNGKWNWDYNGTNTSGTGNFAGNTGQFYYYMETSSTLNGGIFWLRSPEITITENSLSLFKAQNGVNCGDIDVFIDITGGDFDYSSLPNIFESQNVIGTSTNAASFPTDSDSTLGWGGSSRFSTFVSDSTDVQHGSYVIRLNSIPTQVQQYRMIQLNVTAGKTYIFKVWLKANSSSIARGGEISYYHNIDFHVDEPSIIVPTTEWVEYTRTYTAISTGIFQIYFYTSYDAAVGDEELKVDGARFYQLN